MHSRPTTHNIGCDPRSRKGPKHRRSDAHESSSAGVRSESVAVKQFAMQADFFATAVVITNDDALQALGKLADVGPGDRVVDVGCGPDIVAVHLAVSGAYVTGVDMTPR